MTGHKPHDFYSIGAQRLSLHHMTGHLDVDTMHTVNSFFISRQVTFAEYKLYLATIQRDSPVAFYRSQLPDTSMVPDSKTYETYISNDDYDKDPVLGITWESAMNYCRWMTIRENPKDSLTFIYRLPHLHEWLAAYNYLNDKYVKHDFNQTYSDWLITTMYDGFGSKMLRTIFSQDDFRPSVILNSPGDPPAMKRKYVIGNSYRRKTEYPMKPIHYLYCDQGSREVGFRYVVEKLIPSDTSRWSIPNMIIKHWGLKK